MNKLVIILIMTVLALASSVNAALGDGSVNCWSGDVDGTDSLTNANTLIFQLGAGVNTSLAKVGAGSLFFDGSSTAKSTNLHNFTLGTNTSNMSFSFWVYNYNQAGQRALISWGNISGQGATAIGSRKITEVVNGYTYGSDLNTGVTLAKNAWTYIAGNYDAVGDNFSIFINGTFAGTQSRIINLTKGLFWVGDGEDGGGGGNALYGHIDELKVWSRYLTHTELNTDYASGVGTACSVLAPPPAVANFSITALNNHTGATITNFSARITAGHTINQQSFDSSGSTGSWTNVSAFSDGSYTSSTTTTEDSATLLFNYTKPPLSKEANSSQWRIKYGTSSAATYDYNLPVGCWARDPLEFKVNYSATVPVQLRSYCRNATEWDFVGRSENGTGANRAFEEEMIWQIDRM